MCKISTLFFDNVSSAVRGSCLKLQSFHSSFWHGHITGLHFNTALKYYLWKLLLPKYNPLPEYKILLFACFELLNVFSKIFLFVAQISFWPENICCIFYYCCRCTRRSEAWNANKCDSQCSIWRMGYQVEILWHKPITKYNKFEMSWTLKWCFLDGRILKWCHFITPLRRKKILNLQSGSPSLIIKLTLRKPPISVSLHIFTVLKILEKLQTVFYHSFLYTLNFPYRPWIYMEIELGI